MLTNDSLRAMVHFLSNFPADGKVDRVAHRDIGMEAVVAGLIEHREIKKPCPTCGTDRHDHGFFRITTAGRYFLAGALRFPAASERSPAHGSTLTGIEAAGGDAGGEG